jgi:hypothetical protein
MALQMNQETDDSPALPVPRSRLCQALRSLAGLGHIGVQDGAQHGNSHGHHHGNCKGELDGHHEGAHDGESNGTANGNLVFVVRGDTVWPMPQGYRPLPNAREHAQAFLNHLQSIKPMPGRWVASRSLEAELYPRFLQQADWPAQAWTSVARHLRSLKGVKKRQRDRRSGPDRTGPSPTEYFIPHRRAR